MIYFDNAATSRYKPEVVYDAFNFYIREIGTSPGRGSYSSAVQASRMLYQARNAVGKFFGNENYTNVVFTKNSTEAINLFFNGFLNEGDHVLISPFEHNAVLRPLESLKKNRGISYSLLSMDAIYEPKRYLKEFITPQTKLLAITLASNLTGEIIFNREIAEVAKEYGIKIFVDSSQGGGKKLVNMEEDSVDFLAFTGHKDLYALPGVGGLVSTEELNFKPLIQGGTGIYGHEYVNPDVYPEAYEAGTLNMPAIWSLKNSVEFIDNNIEEIILKEKNILSYCMSELRKIDNIVVYKPSANRVSTFCFNINGMSSSDVVSELGRHDICVRGGIHCAILAHEQLDTVSTGAVRVSLNYLNTKEEVDEFIKVIGEMTKCI